MTAAQQPIGEPDPREIGPPGAITSQAERELIVNGMALQDPASWRHLPAPQMRPARLPDHPPDQQLGAWVTCASAPWPWRPTAAVPALRALLSPDGGLHHDLLVAVSDRCREQIGTVLTTPTTAVSHRRPLTSGDTGS